MWTSDDHQQSPYEYLNVEMGMFLADSTIRLPWPWRNNTKLFAKKNVKKKPASVCTRLAF
jgi:hypothetical protein